MKVKTLYNIFIYTMYTLSIVLAIYMFGFWKGLGVFVLLVLFVGASNIEQLKLKL